MARFIETRRLDETVIYINADRVDFVYEESWSRLSEQFFRFDKWSLCRG
jgi:hypothetical protein